MNEKDLNKLRNLALKVDELEYKLETASETESPILRAALAMIKEFMEDLARNLRRDIQENKS